MIDSTELTALLCFGALSTLGKAEGKAEPGEDDRLSRIGAWGLGLFQSDHDYEIIDELDAKLGLPERGLQSMGLEAMKHPRAKVKSRKLSSCTESQIFIPDPQAVPSDDPSSKHEVKRIDMGNEIHAVIVPESENMFVTMGKTVDSRAHHRALTVFQGNEEPAHFSIFGNLCTDVKTVRDLLDSGALARLIAEHEQNFDPSKTGNIKDNYYRDGYKLMLIGTCAMSLGCKLSTPFVAFLKQYFRNVGLKRDALKQMDKALNGPQKYKVGVPYDFGSPSLCDTMLAGGAPKVDKYFSSSDVINVEWPGGVEAEFMRNLVGGVKEKMGTDNKTHTLKKSISETKAGGKSEKREVEAKPLLEKKRDVIDFETQCANCGGFELEVGNELKCCANCKRVKYCGRGCQREHWKEHKELCKSSKGMTQ